MKIIFAILGLLFLLLALANIVTVCIQALAPVVAMIIFLFMGITFGVLAVRMDKSNKPKS